MKRAVRWLVASVLVGLCLVTQFASPVGRVQTANALGDSTRPYVMSSPIFSPKNGSSFTTLFTSAEDVSMSMLLRRYDAVGALLTSQAITIGAHGSLQASPAAHGGAPLHVEIWMPRPHLAMQITYTDSSDVARTIPPESMIKPDEFGVGGSYFTITPSLMCDTRDNGNGTTCAGSKLAADETRPIYPPNVPSNATAVTLLVRVERPTKSSYLTFFTAGRPDIQHIAFKEGAVQSAEITVPFGAGTSVWNKRGSVDLIAYVTGYYR